jgi:protein-tyrosine-phosphatase
MKTLEQVKAEIEAASPYNDGWTQQHYAEEAKRIEEQEAKYAKNLEERRDAKKKDYIVRLSRGDIENLRAIEASAEMNDRVLYELFFRMTEQILDTEIKV